LYLGFYFLRNDLRVLKEKITIIKSKFFKQICDIKSSFLGPAVIDGPQLVVPVVVDGDEEVPGQ